MRERRFQQLRLRVEILLKERILATADHSVGMELFLRSGYSNGTDPYTLAESLFEGALMGPQDVGPGDVGPGDVGSVEES